MVPGVSLIFSLSNSRHLEHTDNLQSCCIVIPLFYAYSGIK